MTACILNVSVAEYHKLPQFSATLAKILITQSALKARDAWERRAEQLAAEAADGEVDDEEVSDEKRKQLDNGSIKHALVLGKGGERIKIVPTEILAKNGSYGTDASKKVRDAARAAGLIPVKEPEMPLHERVAEQIRLSIAAAGHTLDGASEFAIEWEERTAHGPVKCRAMLDHALIWGVPLHTSGIVASHEGPPGAIIYDLKIVGDAHPERCERTSENLGYAIQAAAYTRALTALYPQLGGRIEFRFLFCEQRRPYDLWDPTLDGVTAELGERRWLRAVNAWGEGLATGRWPGYRTPDRTTLRTPIWTLRAEGYQPENY